MIHEPLWYIIHNAASSTLIQVKLLMKEDTVSNVQSRGARLLCIQGLLTSLPPPPPLYPPSAPPEYLPPLSPPLIPLTLPFSDFTLP